MHGSGMSFEDFIVTVIKVLYFCLCTVMVCTVLWLIAEAIVGCIVQWT